MSEFTVRLDDDESRMDISKDILKVEKVKQTTDLGTEHYKAILRLVKQTCLNKIVAFV
jgi:hypothetical protein